VDVAKKKADNRDRELEIAYALLRSLAMLAAKTPQFHNPLEAWAAESVRDAVLTRGAKAVITENAEKLKGLKIRP
jgi:hypothetical protein